MIAFITITFSFVLFRALPGDAVSNLSRVPNMTPEAQAAIRAQFGLDKPRKLADGRTYLGRPPGWPTWRKDESAIVFMYPRAARTGLQTTVGLGYGKVSVAGGAAMNAYENTGLFGQVRVNRALLDASEQQMFDTKSGPVDAVTFQKFLHRAVKGNWVKNGSLANAKR